MIGTFIFPIVFIKFKQLYPNIKLNIIEYGSIETRQMIENGDLDLVLIIGDILKIHFYIRTKMPQNRNHFLF
ncbi:hypothetical protein HLQ16_18410 [Clostridium estertheticum]|uniref:LysR substrate-binding domain-containing protein n=1 Tax=Clostridium estertheticum TaxID=238834 RepID=A0A7Y3SYU2_9CLOT|nr:hypothetical protein [Clostridium estertheticum]